MQCSNKFSTSLLKENFQLIHWHIPAWCIEGKIKEYIIGTMRILKSTCFVVSDVKVSS